MFLLNIDIPEKNCVGHYSSTILALLNVKAELYVEKNAISIKGGGIDIEHISIERENIRNVDAG